MTLVFFAFSDSNDLYWVDNIEGPASPEEPSLHLLPKYVIEVRIDSRKLVSSPAYMVHLGVSWSENRSYTNQ